MKSLTIFFLCITLGAQAQVRFGIDGDTLKGNVKRIIQYSRYGNGAEIVAAQKFDTTKIIYTCDRTNNTELIKRYNMAGKETGREVMQFDNKGHILSDKAYTDLDSLYHKRTWKYDNHGWLIEKRDISYPFHASYPEEEREVNTEFKDSLGDCTEYTYNNLGQAVEKTEEEIWDGKTTIVQMTAYKFDAKGNKIEEYNLNLRVCGDADRHVLFYIGDKGYSRKTCFTYDGYNRLAERIEYAEEKNPSTFSRSQNTGILIGRKTAYNYTGQSNVANYLTSMSLYRNSDKSVTTGTPLTTPNWEAKSDASLELEFDNQGNIIKKKRSDQLIFERTIEYF